jgi:hypothetical protein
MPHITAQDGNVIAADFGPRAPARNLNLAVRFSTQVLYADTAVCLMRINYFLNDQPIAIQHIMTDHVNNTDVPA